MLKQNATWQEIQDAWNDLTHEQQVVTAQKFDADLRQKHPETHAKLTAMPFYSIKVLHRFLNTGFEGD